MTSKLRTAVFGGLLALLPFGASFADDSGFYIGGGLGQAGVELDISDDPGIPAFDEDDTAWKLFAGYKFDLLPVIDLGVEGSYRNLGGPSLDINEPGLIDASFAVDTTSLDIFGVAGFDIGPLGIFGKLGYVFWDAEATVVDRLDPSNNDSFSDDGNDLAYGIGASIGLGSLEIRGEYEVLDIEDTDNVAMWSIGLAYYFN
jgi:opacity protein-like surface antigen